MSGEKKLDTLHHAALRVKHVKETVEWYIQDTWKVSRKLTIDAGLRFGWGTPWHSNQNVEAGFVPEEGKPQQRRVQQKNDDKDQRVNAPEKEFRPFVSSWRGQWLRFSR